VLNWFKPSDAADRLADMIGRDYPLRETHHEARVLITPQGVTSQSGDQVTNLLTVDRSWTVALGSTFLSIETVAYTDHRDFISRLGTVVDALLEGTPIPFLTRLGYRYTNRIDQPEDLANLGSYFNPLTLGPIADGEPEGLVHAATESLYREDRGFLLVRSALLAPNATIDPGLPPLSTKSWILDLDAYTEPTTGELLPVDVRGLADIQAGRARRHFATLVGTQFSERFK
jgi:uncharacterized protein (TIGR04255 family)